jgi:hypothetical protein
MKIKIVIWPPTVLSSKNLIPGSIHEVIERPKYDPSPNRGLWVMGFGEPVKILSHEYELIKE